MARVQVEPDPERPTPRIPPPVPGGTDSIESLGWLIDDVLMGHARTDRRIAREMDDRLMGDDEVDEPPPSEAPPPVPGGDEPITKGDEPEGETRG